MERYPERGDHNLGEGLLDVSERIIHAKASQRTWAYLSKAAGHSILAASGVHPPAAVFNDRSDLVPLSMPLFCTLGDS